MYAYVCTYAYNMRYYPFRDCNNNLFILTHLPHIEILVGDGIAILTPIYVKGKN